MTALQPSININAIQMSIMCGQLNGDPVRTVYLFISETGKNSFYNSILSLANCKLPPNETKTQQPHQASPPLHCPTTITHTVIRADMSPGHAVRIKSSYQNLSSLTIQTFCSHVANAPCMTKQPFEHKIANVSNFPCQSFHPVLSRTWDSGAFLGKISDQNGR